MKIKILPYSAYKNSIPADGHHILAQQTETDILVYQAFNPRIADYAVEHQCFGGKHYSFSRMSWIKPNFLWMMYRCGWAAKENQKRVLGIWIRKSHFDQILEEAVYSSFQAPIYETRENWKAALAAQEVRLQWDPDHDIYGAKQDRRAIQLGLKGQLLEKFGKEMILEIIDLTDFAQQQKALIDAGNLQELNVPEEWIYKTPSENLNRRLRI